MNNKRKHRASFNSNVNTARINMSEEGESLFAANNIRRKTIDNLVRAEEETDEHPLRTDKTDELEHEEDFNEEYEDDDYDEEFEIEVDIEDDDDFENSDEEF